MVTSHDHVLAVGGQTKTRLSSVDSCELISTRNLSGITEYDPSEYTFTALAGTPVKDIHDTLSAKGQFLPCSALLRDSGATIGGAIASGLSGSGRFRFGGLRDFLLGITYVSGDGKMISAGGKVVKNAAGFDLPKFFVGSLGRYGILTEVTFKVFPKPSFELTLKIQCQTHEQALERIIAAAASRWECYAIDYGGNTKQLFLRLGGPPESNAAISEEIQKKWPGDVEVLTQECSVEFWTAMRELQWFWKDDSGEKIAAKVPISPKILPPLQTALDSLDGVTTHYSVAGNVAGIFMSNAEIAGEVNDLLLSINLSGMTFIGNSDIPLWLGKKPATTISSALKTVLDPQNKFPHL